jgi:hypothetical protein
MEKLTWRQRWAIALLMAIAGALYLWAALFGEISRYTAREEISTLILAWATAAAFAGAGLAGFIVASGFGRAGWTGWAIAFACGIVATILGGAIGGTFIIPVYGTISGPFVVVGYAQENPSLMGIWAVLMAGVHLTSLKVRRAAKFT